MSASETDRNGTRPYLKARMPTFFFSEGELRKLVRFFGAMASQAQPYIQARLEPFGLKADIRRDDGILDVLRPGDRAVCVQDPESGARVRRGRTVRVIVSKSC